MAGPTISTDLTVINRAEATTDWSQTDGNVGILAETDFFIEGNTCISTKVSNELGGAGYTAGAAITLSGTDHVFMWVYVTTPGILEPITVNGMGLCVGDTDANFDVWFAEGNDTLIYGGWKCYPVRPSQSPDTTVGTPGDGSTPAFFGARSDMSAAVKGQNVGQDVIWYGAAIDAYVGDTADPITFTGIAAVNDNGTNRWGICQEIPGGVQMQGKLRIGVDDASTASLFDDTGVLVVNPDKNNSAVQQKTLSDFTQLILRGANTEFNVTACTFLSLDPRDKGQLIMDSAVNPVGQAYFLNTGFTSWGTCTMSGSGTFEGCTWRDSDLVTQNSAIITECSFFDGGDGTRQMISDAPDRIDFTSFESENGTWHAIEIETAGTYNFAGNTFTGYALTSGSSGSEAIYNNTSGTVILNVLTGGDVPTYRNGTGAWTIVNANVLITLTGLQTNTEIRVFYEGTTNEVPGTGAESVTTGSHSFSIGIGLAVDISIISLAYQNTRLLNFSSTIDATIPITQVIDRQYENP